MIFLNQYQKRLLSCLLGYQVSSVSEKHYDNNTRCALQYESKNSARGMQLYNYRILISNLLIFNWL